MSGVRAVSSLATVMSGALAVSSHRDRDIRLGGRV
jgi:hypothetical protein